MGVIVVSEWLCDRCGYRLETHPSVGEIEAQCPWSWSRRGKDVLCAECTLSFESWWRDSNGAPTSCHGYDAGGIACPGQVTMRNGGGLACSVCGRVNPGDYGLP